MKKIIVCVLAFLLIGCAPAKNEALAAAPQIQLVDVLSSSSGGTVIKASAYQWTYTIEKKESSDHKEISGDSEWTVVTLPHYKDQTSLLYLFNYSDCEWSKYKPDKILIKSSDEDQPAECDNSDDGAFITLERGKEYMITLLWVESGYRKRGFRGEAVYLFKTE